VARKTLSAREEGYRLLRLKFDNGALSEYDLAQAVTLVEGAKAAVALLERQRAQDLNALVLLVGQPLPRDLPAGLPLAQQGLLADLPAGLPSQLLERRPDVVAAERRVAAAFNRVGEARAAQLPRISLTAGGSSISSDVLVLQNRDNPAWGFGANLFAPLYQGGALRAQVELRTAEQRQAVAAYASTGQRAFGDVENALAAENALRDRAAILDVLVRDNQRALELAREQYRIGTVDLRSVNQRQLALYNARTTRLRVQSEQLAQRVNLHLALGGAFDAATPVPVAAR
jgi:NodT family efflux transporter outer membrane factor (OMF) lipoprotein